MPSRALLGASLEIAPADFEIADPLLDVEFPDGIGWLIADRDRAIVSVSGVGAFAIADGRRIRFQPVSGAALDAVDTWLHGTVAAFLLAQRREFALHANVVEVDGSAIAVAGAQGAGKSTSALRLAQRGHTLVADDVSPIHPEATVTVHPFARPMHVWPETAAALGLDLSGARPALPGRSKVKIPAAEPLAPVMLSAIAVLEPSNTVAAVDAVRVRGACAHELVVAHTYRVRLLSALFPRETFAWAGAIARRVPVHVVRRPQAIWTADAVAESLEQIAAAQASGRYPKRAITSE
jgi:hypothetical protein